MRQPSSFQMPPRTGWAGGFTFLPRVKFYLALVGKQVGLDIRQVEPFAFKLIFTSFLLKSSALV